MSLFIGLLAFANSAKLQSATIVRMLCGSVFSALMGALFLRREAADQVPRSLTCLNLRSAEP